MAVGDDADWSAQTVCGVGWQGGGQIVRAVASAIGSQGDVGFGGTTVTS